MGNWYYPIIFSQLSFFFLTGYGCSGSSTRDDDLDPILHGTISYPFVKSNPLGVNGKQDRFIIRSISNGTEYVIEIPDAGEDYDIEIPMATLSQNGGVGPSIPKGLSPAAGTDREITSSLPDMAKESPAKSSLIDKAFGVGKEDGPGQSPSYTLGLAKITKLFHKKQFEYALIEVNHLLSFFPQSPRLHKMKGTIYVKLHNFHLALKAWTRAKDLLPNDKLLRAGIQRLEQKIKSTTISDNQSVNQAIQNSPENTTENPVPVQETIAEPDPNSIENREPENTFSEY